MNNRLLQPNMAMTSPDLHTDRQADGVTKQQATFWCCQKAMSENKLLKGRSVFPTIFFFAFMVARSVPQTRSRDYQTLSKSYLWALKNLYSSQCLCCFIRIINSFVLVDLSSFRRAALYYEICFVLHALLCIAALSWIKKKVLFDEKN